MERIPLRDYEIGIFRNTLNARAGAEMYRNPGLRTVLLQAQDLITRLWEMQRATITPQKPDLDARESPSATSTICKNPRK